MKQEVDLPGTHGTTLLTCLHFNFVPFGIKLIVDCKNVPSLHLLGAGLLCQNPLF